MTRTLTAGIALLALALAASSGLLATSCDKKGPPEPSQPSERGASPPRASDSALDSLSDGGFDASSAAHKTVTELRRTKLELAPRRTSAERLAFGRDRLAQLGESELIVRQLPALTTSVRVPLQSPRRVTELSDGSLIAAGAEAVVRLDRRKNAPELYPRVPLFPESLLFGDRKDADRLWVLHAFGSLLYQYQVGGDAGGIQTLDFLDLEGFDQRAFCALKDGSFLYTAGDQLVRFFHGGKRWKLRAPEGGEIWRILTTRRIDRVWIARQSGRLELTQISANGANVVSSFSIENAFDVAANDHELAVVQAVSEAGKPRRWTLAIHAPDGKRRFERPLPEEPKPAAGDDWVRSVTRDKTLALSTHARFVAVGGPNELSVWNTKTGEPIRIP